MSDKVTLTANDASAEARAANKFQLQKATDYVLNNGRQALQITTPGVIDCDPGYYADPPGNLRANLTNPSIFNFSFHLKGVGGLGNREGHGTTLRFADNTQPWIISGTGQGMRLSDLTLRWSGGATSRAALNPDGIGVALAGGQGGSTRTLVENVMVEGVRRAFVSGFNADQLCDSVTYRNCFASNCFVGWDYQQSQNYVNAIERCSGENLNRHVISSLGKPVDVIGGNFSGTDFHHNAFTIVNISALAPFSDTYFNNGFVNWTFSAELVADDQAMIDGAYDAFVVKLPGFGLVPLSLVDYNPVTQVATFKIYPGWYLTHFWKYAGWANIDLKVDTDIEAELQAVTTLYASENCTIFSGSGIKAVGTFHELPGVTTRLLDNVTSMRGGRVSDIDGPYLNYNPNQAIYANSSNAEKAIHYCQLAFPIMRVSTESVRLRNPRFDGDIGSSRGLNIEVVGSADLCVENHDFDNPNVHLAASVFGVDAEAAAFTSQRGAGEWDATPFFPTADPGRYQRNKLLGTSFKGWSPEPSKAPRLTQAQVTAVNSLGAIGSYPHLYGWTNYTVLDDTSSPGTAVMFLRSAHRGASYGQDFALAWDYKGQSHVLHLADLSRVFSGLVVILDNGDGEHSYIVTGVYPSLGYCTVRGLSAWLLAGTKTATYSGSTVKQQPYAIKTVSGV